MPDPTTDPRADGSEVPAYVVGRELWQLRTELQRAATALEVVEREDPDPGRRAVWAALRAACYRAVNAGNAAGRPRRLPWWRRVWVAITS